jgi:pilus assembly protein FimV
MSHQGYQQLSTKDVVFVEGLPNSAALFQADSTLRVKDLLTKIAAICAASGQLSAEEVQILFGDGINCEILRTGAEDWTSGRLQLSLGFQPSETVVTAAVISAPAAKATPAPAVTAPVAPATTPSINTSVPQDRASIATPIVKNDPPAEPEPELELDLDQFANATDHGNNPSAELDIDHSDVFSLMEDPDITPLGDDFSFGEVLESMAGLEFDASPAAKSIASPWDLEELDGMLLVK